jgi:hypothetical protein
VRRARLVAAVVLLALAGAAVPAAEAAAARACKRIVNPYPGTRYDGVDITRIRATRVTCRGARRVARRAHRKALGITPPPGGVRRFTWSGWRVTGDLSGTSDRYVATKGARRVSWRF